MSTAQNRNEPHATAVPRVFRRGLANTLVTGVTSTFLWFALTFWVYLETHSVVATGMIGGAFSIASAAAHRETEHASPVVKKSLDYL